METLTIGALARTVLWQLSCRQMSVPHLLELGSPGKTPSSSQGLTCAGSDLHLSDLKLLRLWNLKAFLYLR
ncbi:hypothetical protein NC653_039191 [Populus alba x Populus x berolinensis]|uniref:Uncharacterized protein n=1 Tax=Populus alba x Populus x berolinensis TaxID=444605 RepID=A0AAD6LC71_9ROSI|nr:hypothetical protein NC653_039191 [Populus alba x Populus x berolinensis]